MTGTKQRAKRAVKGGVEMPEDLRKLLTEGILLPDPSDPHAMKCATCGLLVALVLNRPPGIEEGREIPGCVWGEDVWVICACCSFAHCTHKVRAAEGRGCP